MAAHDHYEQEADAVAHRVMTMPVPAALQSVQRQPAPEEKDQEKRLQTKPLASSITPLLQRQTMSEEEKEKPVQAKFSVQRTADTECVDARADLENRLSRGQGGGSALPDRVRSYMEPRFGVNFSGVRVHTDHEAAQMNRAVGAQAFTHGQNIYFGAGKGPDISDLTAHELTHVVQQTGGKMLPSGPPRPSLLVSRRIQRYTVPGTLECEEVVDWLDNNSPYSPEWAQTACTYTFHGNLRISPPVISGAGVSLTVTGHRGLTVSVSCPIDSPQWSPSPRQDRAAVVAAWRRMKTSLDAHEQQHRAIGRAWRATLEARFRAIRFTVTGVDRADAMRQGRDEIASLQRQWIADAQVDQDAIDPFKGAVLSCP